MPQFFEHGVMDAPSSSPPVDKDRELARARVEKRRKFRADVVGYIVINAFLIGVWALTGAGYFWPAWVLAGWGVLLLLDGWNAFFRRPVSESDVDRELQRLR